MGGSLAPILTTCPRGGSMRSSVDDPSRLRGGCLGSNQQIEHPYSDAFSAPKRSQIAV